MLNFQLNYNQQHSDQEILRGLALLILMTSSVIGSSWLFSLPIYFDIKIAAQIFPLIISIVLLFAATRVQHKLLYITVIPLSFILIFLSWSYVVFLDAINHGDEIKNIISAQQRGMSDSVFVFGLCFIVFWLERYFKYAIYLTMVSIISLMMVLFLLAQTHTTSLLALLFLLLGSAIVATMAFMKKIETTDSLYKIDSQLIDEEDFLLPSEIEEQKITPELDINILPLNEASVSHQWGKILRELNSELKGVSDVDNLFKKMLVFLNSKIEFEAAAVGMLQGKSIKKIAVFGGEEFLHTKSLNWTNQRVAELLSTSEPKLSKQTHLAGSSQEPLHRLDVPILSNKKVVGLVTVFREVLFFDMHDVELTSSVVFHSMVSLMQSRLQEEVKRLSAQSKPTNLTLYSREQFVNKVKPVFEKLSKPRECSLFIVEIDNLDTVLDKQGKEASLLLYKNTYKVIMSKLRETDLLGRYGSDGFVVLLDETDLNGAKALAEKVRVKVENIKCKYKEFVITTTVSIGLTIVSDQSDDLSALLRKADMGLFVAKENGSNTIKVSL